MLTATADNSIIRGLVIRDFVGDGIQIDSGSSGNTIEGNYIGSFGAGGTNLGATEANTLYGINVLGNNNTIGGTTAVSRNVIGGNQAAGIRLTGAGAFSNSVIGNYIGTDRTGIAATANSTHGIFIDAGANTNTIGGSTSSHTNVISGNSQCGIWIVADSNTVQGNLIGVGADGTTSLGNAWDAVTIDGSNNLIGGPNSGQGNTLANNGDDGIEVIWGNDNSFLRNIYSNNGSMAIDLGGNNSDFYANDFGDADSGSNELQNFPVLKTATSANGNTTITGKLNSTANTTFRIEFYSNPYGTSETWGYGEGRTYLGFTEVTTDANGNVAFSALLTGVTVSSGSTVTATATQGTTGSYGSTSEFGGNILVNQSNLLISGSYTGNGIDNRIISGLGFRAEVIFVMSNTERSFELQPCRGTLLSSAETLRRLSPTRFKRLRMMASTSGTVLKPILWHDIPLGSDGCWR